MLVGLVNIAHAGLEELRGQVGQGYYSDYIGAPANQRAFKIELPRFQNQKTWRSVDVNQVITPDSTYISFGPGTYDQTIYRIMIAPRDESDYKALKKGFAHFANKEARHFAKMFSQAYEQPMILISAKQMKIHKHDAIYRMYKQTIMTKKHWFSRKKPQIYYYAVYILDAEPYNINFIMQTSTRLGPISMPKSEEAMLENASYRPFNQFVESLLVT